MPTRTRPGPVYYLKAGPEPTGKTQTRLDPIVTYSTLNCYYKGSKDAISLLFHKHNLLSESIVSLISLVVLSYDRYNTLTVYHNRGPDYRKPLLAVGGSWLYSLIWTVPPLLGWSSYGLEGAGTSCSVSWTERTTQSHAYIICLFLFCLGIPVLIMVYCYGRLLYAVKQIYRRSWSTHFGLPSHFPQSASASPMAMPASYAGEPAGCGGFLLQLALYIEMQPLKFPTDRIKVAFLISLLSGHALSWVKAIWNANTAITNSYKAFTNHFKEVFGSATGELSVSDQLLWLRQGAMTTNDYTVQFQTLVVASEWNEAGLLSTYWQGLSPHIHAQVAIYDNSFGLEKFMRKANRVSQNLAACHTTEAAHQPVSPASGPPVPEPLQVDSTRLSQEEHTRRLAAGLCLCCAAADHFMGACPVKPPHPALPRHRHAQELRDETIQGKLLGRGHVRYQAPPVKIKIGLFHEEEIKFLVGKIRKTAARKREYHVLFMVITTVVCYLLCWMPYGVVAMMATFGRPGIISPVASVVPSLLAKSSTVINPLIYILMNKQCSFQCL
ncbi:hypothetical protein cypCar_00010363 [Cyprinus carpio]|nr:hypothetical protein cypCar_00010363 [Cyprinus carpio]